jgi:glycosyltransferase involved in cell wall biosynthesis
MNIVFISGFLAEQSMGGPALRAKNSLKILEKLGDVSAFDLDRISPFTWTGGAGNPGAGKSENQPKVPSAIDTALKRRISRALQVLEIFTQLVSLSAFFKIRRLIVKTSPDVVWFSFATKFPRLFLALRRTFPSVVFVADTDAVISTHLRRASESLSGFRRLAYRYLSVQTSRYESKILLEASVTTAVSEFDLQEYNSRSPSAKLFVFPNVVPTHELDVFNEKKSPTPRVLITGTYGGPESAMTHGTLWFLREVFPKVRKLVPDLSVDIVGRNASQILDYVNPPETVRVLSDVPSLTPYLSEAWCSACPLFFESGTRFKILEASERAVPTVSTAVGAEGLDFVNGQDILIADDPADFAQSILKLLENQDIRESMGKRSRETLVSRYSMEAGYSAARMILDQRAA